MACRLLLGILLATIMGLPCSELSAQEAKDEIGLKVGAKVENFSLEDQSGKARDFDDMLKAGPIAIVFFRSADW